MKIKERKEVAAINTWDTSVLYPSQSEWQTDCTALKAEIKTFVQYKGKLASSAQTFLAAFTEWLNLSRKFHKIYTFAHMNADVDTTNSEAQGQLQIAFSLYSELGAITSFMRPEILLIPNDILSKFLAEPSFKPYLRTINEIARYKPHTLSSSEENLLALGTEVLAAPNNIFGQLNNADFDFGTIIENGVEKPLTHGTYFSFLKSENREIRKEAFEKHYGVFDAHKNTLSAVLTASIKRDVFASRARNHNSSLEMSLFPDYVPLSLYDNLVTTVTKRIATVHRIYNIKKKLLNLSELEFYDINVQPKIDVKFNYTYEEASKLLIESLAPLGEEYTTVLTEGLLTERWTDRYENKGKRSGAYSTSCYEAHPFLLMNYKDEEIRDIFTLTHEAGHAMHSYFSNKHQPYQDHDYPIFTAEVASTFNEQLLFHHMMKNITDPKERIFLLNHRIDDINATLFRQTQYAEFEKIVHEVAEKSEPLTVDLYRKIWSDLLLKYHGSAVKITLPADLGCFRIPHFYNAFYVYKYATGLAAAIALSEKVLNEGAVARDKYLNFIRSGCSKPPLDLLKEAGVDLLSPEPVEKAIDLVDRLVNELEESL